VDRKANMIITGGENVYPSEVEEVVGAHEAIKDIAVIGIPDEKWGEAIKAIIVLHDGYEASPDMAKAILDFSRGKIAGYKRPKTIDFVADDEMPRTPTGKILHRVLREKFGKWSDS
jgi:acyl-CoA synthetase (AMP-forming)/AMP-acid ligase II